MVRWKKERKKERKGAYQLDGLYCRLRCGPEGNIEEREDDNGEDAHGEVEEGG